MLYSVSEVPLGTPRKLRIIMVGGGASGLNTARHMELHMENYELQIYEKNADIGGTWFENRSDSFLNTHTRGISTNAKVLPDIQGVRVTFHLTTISSLGS
jgi:monoamine oxidase